MNGKFLSLNAVKQAGVARRRVPKATGALERKAVKQAADRAEQILLWFAPHIRQRALAVLKIRLGG